MNLDFFSTSKFVGSSLGYFRRLNDSHDFSVFDELDVVGVLCDEPDQCRVLKQNQITISEQNIYVHSFETYLERVIIDLVLFGMAPLLPVLSEEVPAAAEVRSNPDSNPESCVSSCNSNDLQ